LARKILLADDSVTAQNMGRKILADAGYEVITVNNGSAALKKIAELKPDLIVLDVYMPGYSGLEVCQRLKEAGETARIPVLLTVGKLEPFKPEEAKRVRADGYIVKPFEASELLSALTKLEDKMVPRAETSKPGRFARTIAAVEEGRYDKSVAMEEDTGWKSRIGFPSKKKQKAAESEDNDDSAIYNQINRDLRTVVDRPPVHHSPKASAPDERVDLGALAPEGLPKDVTPEEIAALAAAAAQMHGKVAENKGTESAPEQAAAIPYEAREPAKIEVQAEAKIDEAKIAEQKTEDKAETKEWSQPAAATFAEQKPEDRIEASQEKPGDAAPEAASLVAPTPADVSAAISGLETSASVGSSTNGSASHDSVRPPEPEPVTMAVAAGAERAAMPHWTAVSVALAPEESAIVLEDEMRKAYAAFAAAEMLYPSAIPTVHESQPAQAEPAAAAHAIPSPVEAVAEPVAPATREPEVTQSIADVSSLPTETISAAVKQFETVTASYVEAQAPPAVEPASVPGPLQPAEAAIPPAAEVPQFVDARPDVKSEAQPEETPVAQAAAAEPVFTQPSVEEQFVSPPPPPEPRPEAEARSESSNDTPRVEAQESEAARSDAQTGEVHTSGDHASGDHTNEDQASRVQANEDRKAEEPAVPEPVAAAAVEESPAVSAGQPTTSEPVAVSEVPAYQVSAIDRSADATEPAATSEPPRPPDPAKKESEFAATTAAAWASWRRIRESGDPRAAESKEPADHQPSSSSSSDEAAMAVAAGAEKAPEEGPEIANIVDSVLADLRPRIVEEISRKLRKKK
jgi:CheY-like chemotaxis protein